MTGPPFITSKGERQTTELRKVCVAWEMSYQHMLVDPKTIWSGYFFFIKFLWTNERTEPIRTFMMEEGEIRSQLFFVYIYSI